MKDAFATQINSKFAFAVIQRGLKWSNFHVLPINSTNQYTEDMVPVLQLGSMQNVNDGN